MVLLFHQHEDLSLPSKKVFFQLQTNYSTSSIDAYLKSKSEEQGLAAGQKPESGKQGPKRIRLYVTATGFEECCLQTT